MSENSKRIISIFVSTILILGAIGFIVYFVTNRQVINNQFEKDIDAKNSTEFAYVLQEKITNVKQEVNNLAQKRKVNSNMDRLDLQENIDQTIKKIEETTKYLEDMTVVDNQVVARDNTLAALNELKYSLNELKEESTKDTFKTQGNENVDKIYNDINNENLKIDDYIDLWN